jgi:hypothetical protein
MIKKRRMKMKYKINNEIVDEVEAECLIVSLHCEVQKWGGRALIEISHEDDEGFCNVCSECVEFHEEIVEKNKWRIQREKLYWKRRD